MTPRALPLCLVALAGCGGDDGPTPPRSTPSPSPEAVVRGWAADMRRSDIVAATARFAVPAIVANGTPEIRLETRAQVAVFNEQLPCGGRVVRTERRGRFVVATFVLVDRPRSKCDGPGGRAKAAFEVRDGKIVRWLRVPMEGEPEPPPGDVV
ncbi:MAG TPA: hypothetical protein VF529_16625 [Solirubrobacteraceae bacterium]